MKPSGVADLPPHGGRVPSGLAERMTALGTAIVESLTPWAVDYGQVRTVHQEEEAGNDTTPAGQKAA